MDKRYVNYYYKKIKNINKYNMSILVKNLKTLELPDLISISLKLSKIKSVKNQKYELVEIYKDISKKYGINFFAINERHLIVEKK